VSREATVVSLYEKAASRASNSLLVSISHICNPGKLNDGAKVQNRS
jgi:hypothetical protein